MIPIKYIRPYALGPKESPPKQDLEPFSRFCTAQSRDRETDRQTDTHCYGIIIIVKNILIRGRDMPQNEIRNGPSGGGILLPVSILTTVVFLDLPIYHRTKFC